MRVAQSITNQTSKANNKSFQKELWNQIWSKSSFEDLVHQLTCNPAYWRLKELINKEDKILEAGCGFSQWVWRLSSLGYNITGVDIADKTIKQLKQRFPKLRVEIADVEHLPFKDKTFDVYLSFGVIEHFEHGPDKVLSEANRVLKEEGFLFLTVPFLNFFRLLRYGILSRSQGKFYQYLYSKGEIISKITQAGFKISQVTHLDFLSAFKKDFPLLAKLFLRDKILKAKRVTNHNLSKPSDLKEHKPDFRLQRILYKLDSYIILIEAYKN